jgi:hypothetical protein
MLCTTGSQIFPKTFFVRLRSSFHAKAGIVSQKNISTFTINPSCLILSGVLTNILSLTLAFLVHPNLLGRRWARIYVFGAI